MTIRLPPDETGHYTYECKNPRPYVSRPSRTQQLENPKVREKMKNVVEVPDEFKNKPRVSCHPEISQSCLHLHTAERDWLAESLKRKKRPAQNCKRRPRMLGK